MPKKQKILLLDPNEYPSNNKSQEDDLLNLVVEAITEEKESELPTNLNNELSSLATSFLSLKIQEFQDKLMSLVKQGLDIDDLLWATVDFMPKVPENFDDTSAFEYLDHLGLPEDSKQAAFLRKELKNHN